MVAVLQQSKVTLPSASWLFHEMPLAEFKVQFHQLANEFHIIWISEPLARFGIALSSDITWSMMVDMYADAVRSKVKGVFLFLNC